VHNAASEVNLVWLLATAALGGYGDASAGFPRPNDLLTLAWVDAVRVGPDRIKYACDFATFQPDEQTPKTPLRFNAHLFASARAHSEDMQAHNYVGKDSFDGTPFADRIGGYYTGGTVAEDVSSAHGSPFLAIADDIMCQDAARATLMSDALEDGGGAFVSPPGPYITADFGAGESGPTPKLYVAASDPGIPTMSATMLAIWSSDAGPDVMEVQVDGVATPMKQTGGVRESGAWAVPVSVEIGGCLLWTVHAVQAGTDYWFPEDGSYGWGDCDWDDADAHWVNHKLDQVAGPDPGDTDTDAPGDTSRPAGTDGPDTVEDKGGCGCASDGAGAGPGALAGLLLTLAGLRSRRMPPSRR
jgi:MYXO-CTERM domain-containing protein